MKKQMVTMSFGGPIEASVEAEIVRDLAIHRTLKWYPEDNVFHENNTWMVTHILSGLLVAEFATRKAAVRFARTASEMLDFNGYAEALCTNSVSASQSDTVRAILRLAWEDLDYVQSAGRQINPTEVINIINRRVCGVRP